MTTQYSLDQNFLNSKTDCEISLNSGSQIIKKKLFTRKPNIVSFDNIINRKKKIIQAHHKNDRFFTDIVPNNPELRIQNQNKLKIIKSKETKRQNVEDQNSYDHKNERLSNHEQGKMQTKLTFVSIQKYYGKSVEKHKNMLPSTYPQKQFTETNYQKIERKNSTKSLNSSLIGQCKYCQNNKRAVSLMKEKAERIEKQMKMVFQSLRRANQKVDCLEHQKQNLKTALDQLNFTNKQSEFTIKLQSEDLKSRLDDMRRQVIKTSEKLKYLEIENTMLLRKKDNAQQLRTQLDCIRCENEELRRQISFKINQQLNWKEKVQIKPKILEEDLISFDLSSEHSYDRF